jgi:hypothetical protein
MVILSLQRRRLAAGLLLCTMPMLTPLPWKTNRIFRYLSSLVAIF